MDSRNMQRVDSPSSQSPACASCKHQRKKCTQNCILAPFFPAHKKQEFEAVQQVFGVSNIVKALRKIPQQEHQRFAVDSIIWEASEWEKDHVRGPLGTYKKVLQELEFYKNEYHKNQLRKNLKQTQYPFGVGQTATANGNGNGVGGGNGCGAGGGVINEPGYNRISSSGHGHGMLQNIRHNNMYQDFDTSYDFDGNNPGFLLPQQNHSNGFVHQYSVTGSNYNSMNNGNGKITESSMWESKPTHKLDY